MVWNILALAIRSILFWLANGIRKIGAVSFGEPIPARSNTALLLIDLQTAFWDAGTFTETAKAGVKTRILTEVEKAKNGWGARHRSAPRMVNSVDKSDRQDFGKRTGDSGHSRNRNDRPP